MTVQEGDKGWSDTAYIAHGNPVVDVESGSIITPNECQEVTVQGVYPDSDPYKTVVLAQDDSGREISTYERYLVYKLEDV